MVQSFNLKGGYNISIQGSSPAEWLSEPAVKTVAVSAEDYDEIRWRPLCKKGDSVKVGTPVLEDKRGTGVVQVSPVSGSVRSVVRGDKRKLLYIEIESDGQDEVCAPLIEVEVSSREKIIEVLSASGLWPFIKRRPYSVMAHPNECPAQIFVNAMKTTPLAPDSMFCLKNQESLVQKGLNVLKELTEGNVYLSYGDSQRSFFEKMKNVHQACFKGAHPSGNTSTHIYYLNPRGAEEVYWTIDIFDVVRIGELFENGDWQKKTYSVLTGDIEKRGYIKVPLGSAYRDCLGEEKAYSDKKVFIDKDVLSGKSKNFDQAYLSFDTHQIHALPVVRDRYFLRFLRPGWKEFSLSKMFLGGAIQGHNFDSDLCGSLRNIVLNDVYDKYTMLDIPVYFLIKAVLAQEWDEAIRLGLLDTVPEDFALCTFVCPSKVNVGEIVRRGLEILRQEEE